jgi:hypothetical protein
MLECAIVPDSDRTRLPAQAALHLGHIHMAQQEIQQRNALRSFDSDKASRVGGVDEQCLFARFRVAA